MSKSLNKILVIRFSSIGDIVLASPMVRALRNTFPAAQIDFLVKKEFADLVKFNPHISSVIELKTDEREELRSLREKIKFINYDAIIDIHNSLRSCYLRWFSKTRNISVVNKRVVTRFMLVQFKWNFYRKIDTVADRYLQAVQKYGTADDGKGLEIYFSEETPATVRLIMDRYNLKRYNVVMGMAPSARHFTKRWLPERYVELGVEFAKKEHAKIFVFGSKNEQDYCGDIAHMINTKSGLPAAESFAGKLTLLENAAAFDYCNIVITNDTGLMHLAVARKRKIIAIFGSTVKEFGFYPSGQESIVVEQKNLSCRPCSHIGLSQCPKDHFRCMKDTTMNMVFQAAQNLIHSRVS